MLTKLLEESAARVNLIDEGEPVECRYELADHVDFEIVRLVVEVTPVKVLLVLEDDVVG